MAALPRARYAKIFLPILLALSCAIAIYGVLEWAARSADRVAAERQAALISFILSETEVRIAREQESVTVWDDAVTMLLGDRDAAWLDDNLGKWMHEHYHHDGAFIVDATGLVITAYLADGVQPKGTDGVLNQVWQSEVTALRAKMRAGGMELDTHTLLSPGASSLRQIFGRPAIVSAKPIVSESGDIAQEPGREFIQVAIRFIDGDFLSDVGRNYDFDSLRYDVGESASTADRYHLPIYSSAGDVIGTVSWRPFAPGSAVRSAAIPVVVLGGGIVTILIAGLTVILARRSRKLAASQQELLHMASHDMLSGLENRRSFSKRLEELTSSKSMAILYLDLDGFKTVNDTLGHAAGDEVIVQVAARLRHIVASHGYLARLGGDEFAIAMRGADRPLVEALAASIIQAIARPIAVGNDREAKVGVSIGIAFAKPVLVDANALTKQADLALYASKASGRNRYTVFDQTASAVEHRPGRRAMKLSDGTFTNR